MFHPDIITELNKVMTFSKTNKKKKRKALFDLFVDWLQTTNTRYNRAHKNFFILGIGHMSADDTKKNVLGILRHIIRKECHRSKIQRQAFSG